MPAPSFVPPAYVPHEKRQGRERSRVVGRKHLRLVSSTDAEPRHLPATREECEHGERPCPYVSCKHHLYLDVSRKGSIKLNFPDLEPWELPYSCALDAAEAGGLALEQVARLMNVTRERVRQIEERALFQLQADLAARRELRRLHEQALEE